MICEEKENNIMCKVNSKVSEHQYLRQTIVVMLS